MSADGSRNDKIDKSQYGEGPWSAEPDRIEWRHAGLPCLIARGPTGALCGYVGVPLGHPWYGRDPGDVDAHAHGGISYTGPCHGEICHVPKPGEPDNVWWVGFDCAHAYDLMPCFTSPAFRSVTTYRDVGYVTCEVNDLAEQARALAR